MNAYEWHCTVVRLLKLRLSSQIADGHLSVRADLGEGERSLTLVGPRLDGGQWLLAGLVRHDGLFTLRLERGVGTHEVSGILAQSWRLAVPPATLLLGSGPGRLAHQDFHGRPTAQSHHTSTRAALDSAAETCLPRMNLTNHRTGLV